MSDIVILKEMLKESARVGLEKCPYNNNKKQVILKELKSDYSFTISGMPDESEVVVIDADAFPAPNSVFNGVKHECKRADFVIIASTDKRKVIICIEMKAKATTSRESSIVQQLQGAKCFIAYCQEIGKTFWKNKSFLDGYDYRYVSVKNISLSKKPSRYNTNIHDQPEKMLKISSPHNVQFKHLI